MFHSQWLLPSPHLTNERSACALCWRAPRAHEASTRGDTRGKARSLRHTRPDQGWTLMMLAVTLKLALLLEVRSRALHLKTRDEFAQLMANISYTNTTLLNYFFPAEPPQHSGRNT